MLVSPDGKLRMAPWSVPRLVRDAWFPTGGDGPLTPETALPGKLLIDGSTEWVNDAPIDQEMLIRVTRSTRFWLTSNPNAIQFRDRWTWKIDGDAPVPLTTTVLNSQVGSALDVGTNTVAEPNPGRHWVWWGMSSADEWVGALPPGSRLKVRYRCYVWTPPPFSDNANKNSPEHFAAAWGTRLQLMSFPTQGQLVVG
jgi:hypothetical protein